MPYNLESVLNEAAYQATITTQKNLNVVSPGQLQVNGVQVAASGIVNANGNTITLRTSGATDLTLPTSGTMVTTTATQTLTNKTTTGLSADGFLDTNGNKVVEIDAITAATGVNFFIQKAAATGQAVILQANGSDTDVYLNMVTKGAGTVRANGVDIDTISGTQTLSNKRITKRVTSLSSNSATPTFNTDNCDVVHITAQTTAITSFTSGLSGTPVDGDTLRISVTGTTSVAITWGTSFESSTSTLPSTTSSTTRLDIGFFWNTETSKWRCVASA